MSPRIARLALATLLTLSVTAPGAWAAKSSPVAATARQSAVTAAGSLKAVSTFLHWGSSGGAPLVAGFNDIDAPITINCGNAAGCTIGVASMVQIAPYSSTVWAICPVVDGINYMNPPCPYQGSLDGVGGFVTGNSLANLAVTSGTHTVQLRVYVNQAYVGQAAELHNWQVNYTLYKP